MKKRNLLEFMEQNKLLNFEKILREMSQMLPSH